MNCQCEKLCEELSEIVSDQIDTSIPGGVMWMRCSPGLPEYVQGLESENKRLREVAQEIVNRFEDVSKSDKCNCIQCVLVRKARAALEKEEA